MNCYKKENKKKKYKTNNSCSWLRTWKLLTYFNVFCPSTFVAFWVWYSLIHVVFWPTSKYPRKLVFNNQVVTNVFIDICVSAGQLTCSLLLGNRDVFYWNSHAGQDGICRQCRQWPIPLVITKTLDSIDKVITWGLWKVNDTRNRDWSQNLINKL